MINKEIAAMNTVKANKEENMNINSMKKADLVTLCTSQNEKIKELEAALAIANMLNTKYENLLAGFINQTSAEKPFVTENPVSAPKKPARTQKQAEKMIAEKEERAKSETPTKPMTWSEKKAAWKAEKYGDLDTRRHYVEVRNQVADEIAAEVKKSGKRYPYKEYLEILQERTQERIAAEGKKKGAKR